MEGFVFQGSKQESQKFFPFVKMAENHRGVPMSVKAPNIPLSPPFLYNSGIFYSYFSIKKIIM